MSNIHEVIDVVKNASDNLNLIFLLDTYPDIHFRLPDDIITLHNVNKMRIRNLGKAKLDEELLEIDLTDCDWYEIGGRNFSGCCSECYAPLRRKEAEKEMAAIKEKAYISLYEIMNLDIIAKIYIDGVMNPDITPRVAKKIMVNTDRLVYSKSSDGNGYFLTFYYCKVWLRGTNITIKPEKDF